MRSLRKPWRHRLRSMGHGLARLSAPCRTRVESTLRAGRPFGHHGVAGRLVITLTSYPPRFGSLALTLQSLLNQSVRADDVVLWLHAPDVAKLPRAVKRLQREGLRIAACERDWRSYKKIVPALLGEPDTIWVTVDDDVYYPRHWLASLVAGHRADPAAVICGRAHLPRFDAAGGLLPYGRWIKQTPLGGDDDPLFFTGIGGVLYPPRCLHPDATDAWRFSALSPDADDIWLNWMVRLQGTRIRRVGDNGQPVTWLGSQGVSLFKRNARGSGNDIALERMAQAYGVACLRRPAAISAERAVGTAELDVVQPAVDATSRHQLGMAADLLHAALVEHDDAVGVDDGREPVRDDQRGAAALEVLDRGLHRALALGVERAGGFVE